MGLRSIARGFGAPGNCPHNPGVLETPAPQRDRPGSATRSPQITMVTVDVGGVLHLPDLAAVADGRSLREVEAIFQWCLERHGSDGDSRWALFARALGDGHTEQSVKEACLPWNRVLPTARAFMADLAAGIPRVVVVSNANGTVADVLVRNGVARAGLPVNLGIHGHNWRTPAVERVIDSAEVGVRKPDQRIFRRALDGITPENAVHVGDEYETDVKGALEAGMGVIHLDRFGTCPAPQGHAHAGSLHEVLLLLGLPLSHSLAVPRALPPRSTGR